MAVSQKRSKKKPSGGRYKKSVKKLRTLGSLPTFTKLDKTKVKEKRAKGGHIKLTLLSANKANILDPKTKKSQITEILTVVDNPANRHFIRRNILTKGTIVETKLGKAKITNKPGREGSVNAILI